MKNIEHEYAKSNESYCESYDIVQGITYRHTTEDLQYYTCTDLRKVARFCFTEFL